MISSVYDVESAVGPLRLHVQVAKLRDVLEGTAPATCVEVDRLEAELSEARARLVLAETLFNRATA